MVMRSSASFLFYVGPLNHFFSFSYVLHVHMQGNASFNVLYVIDVDWSHHVESRWRVLDMSNLCTLRQASWPACRSSPPSSSFKITVQPLVGDLLSLCPQRSVPIGQDTNQNILTQTEGVYFLPLMDVVLAAGSNMIRMVTDPGSHCKSCVSTATQSKTTHARCRATTRSL